jgi:hypothetical protein
MRARLVGRHQSGVDRCGEARIVEHQADIVVAAVAGLALASAQLGTVGIDAIVGLIVAALGDRNDVEPGTDGAGTILGPTTRP